MPAPEAADTPPIAPDTFGQRDFAFFWDVFLTVAFGAGIYEATGGQPGLLATAPGAWMLFLIVAFATAHRWFWGHARRDDAWPPGFRDTLFCVVVQLALLMPLLPLSVWFGGPLLALMGQVAAATPPRRWWLPLGAPALVLAGQLGLFDAIGNRDWARAVGLAAAIGWAVAIFLYMQLLLDERHARERLHDDLALLREEIASARSSADAMRELRRRDLDARTLRESLGHTLAALNIRLETAERLMAEDPTQAAAELGEIRAILRGALAEVRELPPEMPAADASAQATPDAPDSGEHKS